MKLGAYDGANRNYYFQGVGSGPSPPKSFRGAATAANREATMVRAPKPAVAHSSALWNSSAFSRDGKRPSSRESCHMNALPRRSRLPIAIDSLYRGFVLTARTLDLIPKKLNELYEFHEWRNALAILSAAYPEEWSDIISVLSDFRLLRSDIEKSADGEKFGDRSKVVIRLDDLALRPRGWIPREFATAIVVDDVRIDSPTHEVDCPKGKVALEVEWNNKTEFYDRDLNNFRRLFELQAIDVGVIITRCDELQTIFKRLGRAKSFGSSTTILSKLKRKIDGGAGGGCPVLIVGMKQSLYLDDVADTSVGSRFVRIVREPKIKTKGK